MFQLFVKEYCEYYVEVGYKFSTVSVCKHIAFCISSLVHLSLDEYLLSRRLLY